MLTFGRRQQNSRRRCGFETMEKVRRAQDSNLQGDRSPVDFKSTALPVEASPPCSERPLFTIHRLALERATLGVGEVVAWLI
jgi:hypothetical protein